MTESKQPAVPTRDPVARIDAQIAALQATRKKVVEQEVARNAERDRILARSPDERRAEIAARIIAHRTAVNAAEALAGKAVL